MFKGDAAHDLREPCPALGIVPCLQGFRVNARKQKMHVRVLGVLVAEDCALIFGQPDALDDLGRDFSLYGLGHLSGPRVVGVK